MAKRGCVTLSCVKSLFLICTIMLWLTAAGIFGVGVWTLVAKNDYEALLGSITYVATASIMIAAGVFALFVCIFGMVGGCRESRFMVLGFFVMITLVFLLELIAGVVAYVYRGEVRTEVTRSLNVTIATHYGALGQEESTRAIDKLQKSYRCCGDVDYMSWQFSDWRKLRANSSRAEIVPESCCISQTPKCGVRIHPSNIWRNDVNPLGCFSKLERYLYNHLFIMGCVGVAIGLVQFTCMGLSMWLYRMIVESYY